MADHMTAEQLRAELERIARWLTGEVCIVGDENGEAPATAHDYELDQAAGALHALAARLSGMAAVPDDQVVVPRKLSDQVAHRLSVTWGIAPAIAHRMWDLAIIVTAPAAPEPPHA